MANDKRLIDPSVLIRDLTAMKFMYDAIALDGIIKALKEAPTVDAVEVVHCCDCQNCTAFQQFADSEVLLFCEKWKGHPLVDPTDFCSYGERKGE